MWPRDWSVGLARIVTCLALLQSSAHSSVTQGSPAPAGEKIEELAALGRLWGEVKFVHPWLYSRDIDWDAALLLVIPEAIGSQGPEEFRAVIAKLLAALNDPITRLAEPASSEESCSSTRLSPFFQRQVARPESVGTASAPNVPAPSTARLLARITATAPCGSRDSPRSASARRR